MAVKIYILITAVMSVAAFCAYGADKRRSRRGKWRIPESTLMALAFLGGALGAFIGMRFFRHKTRKPKFFIGVPAALLLWAAAGVLIILERQGILWTLY